MFVPIVKKIMKRNEVLVERVLPAAGNLVAKKGDIVEPPTKLGMAKVSYGELPLDRHFKPTRKKKEGTYFYTGDLIGHVGRKKIRAPFDGMLVKNSGQYSLKQEEKDFWLLSGVWGEVVDVVEGKSALVKTQTLDFSFAASTKNSYAGEMIVFPNPSEILEMQYLEKFSKDSFGKVIYVGNYLDVDLLNKAVDLGVGGIITGSTERKVFEEAKNGGIFVGSISGFGHIPTPEFIFDTLKNLSNRYVFLQGNRGLLRVPVESSFSSQEVRVGNYTGQLRKIKVGLKVQVFEEPYFGWVGEIDSIQGEDIYVNVDESNEPIQIRLCNILSLE